MLRTIIRSWDMNSESARALADALGIKLMKKEGSTFRGGPDTMVINWGSSEIVPVHQGTRILNNPLCVRDASHKLRTFQKLKGKVRMPEFTEDPMEAMLWDRVVCRFKLQGSDGDGIVLWSPGTVDLLPKAPLYVKYVKKKAEYRVHVAGGTVLDVVKKVPSRDAINPNYEVQTGANGFVWKRFDLLVPQDVLDQAVLSVSNLRLDFAGVDVIWNEYYQKAYVLEVNTAPQITTPTELLKYKNYFLSEMQKE